MGNYAVGHGGPSANAHGKWYSAYMVSRPMLLLFSSSGLGNTPVESLAVRKAAVGFKSLGGVANKIKLAYTMLTLPAWHSMNLTVNFFSTKYTKHYAGCPTLPNQMKVHVRSMDELPCYAEGYSKDMYDDIFKFENDLYDDNDDEEQPDTSGGSHELEPRLDDVTMPFHVSDTENHEEPVVEDESGKTDRFMASFLGKDDGEATKISGSCDQVEVIDVFTPSPEYRVSSRRKKRGVSAVCPEVIDLTHSPIWV